MFILVKFITMKLLGLLLIIMLGFVLSFIL